MAYSYFSWRHALVGSFDIFHVHFPEGLIRGGTPTKARIKRILFRFFLLRLRLTRRPVVRTVHNAAPHDSGDGREVKLLDALDRLVSMRVVLNDCTQQSWQGPTVLIPHGDYREQLESLPRGEMEPARILLFGRIRPYKGALELIRAGLQEDAAGLHIRVVGSPTPELRREIEQTLESRQPGGARITTELRTVSDEEMVQEFSEAEIAVVPNADLAQSNSGVALMSLSLDRPVAIRRVCLTESLATEAGRGWVTFLDDGLTGESLWRSIREIRQERQSTSPNLQGRDWPSIASAYAGIFRDLLRPASAEPSLTQPTSKDSPQ
ncbi:hypothetical protein [Microbacterium sp. CIAB417]|uniref:hypothetical protein n=1 Tax=Microbacterium sp. CIAB417 TaxID=2860287 RepID=UPI001FAC49E2|nr:hypothetical protein [Microbacterium sp. CIAB417]